MVLDPGNVRTFGRSSSRLSRVVVPIPNTCGGSGYVAGLWARHIRCNRCPAPCAPKYATTTTFQSVSITYTTTARTMAMSLSTAAKSAVRASMVASLRVRRAWGLRRSRRSLELADRRRRRARLRARRTPACGSALGLAHLRRVLARYRPLSIPCRTCSRSSSTASACASSFARRARRWCQQTVIQRMSNGTSAARTALRIGRVRIGARLYPAGKPPHSPLTRKCVGLAGVACCALPDDAGMTRLAQRLEVRRVVPSWPERPLPVTMMHLAGRP